MGVSTGTALIALHDHFMNDNKPILPLHQIACIRSKCRQTGFRMADRADPDCVIQTFCLLLNQLPVGKRYLIQLAKDGKRTYHKYGGFLKRIRLVNKRRTEL